MTEKQRRINQRSLENLKLGAEARRQGKERHNYTILPETHEWLGKSGNASSRLDELVAAAKKGEGNSDCTHQRIKAEQQVSNNVCEQIESLKAEAEQMRSRVAALEKENANLTNTLGQQLSEYEAARERVLTRWRVQKRAESKERIREALDKLIAEMQLQ